MRMANVGKKFFATEPETNIKITNLDAVTMHKDTWELLLGITLPASKGACYWYESIGNEEPVPSSNPIEGTEGYLITVQNVILALENAGRDATPWEQLEATEGVIAASCCSPT